MRHGLGRRVFLVAFQNVLGTALGYLGLWGILRYLGVGPWGIIGFATAFHFLLSSILLLPADKAMIKLLNSGEEESEVFSSTLLVKAFSGAAFALAIGISILFWIRVIGRGFETPYHIKVLLLLIPYSVLGSVVSTYRSYLDAHLMTASSVLPAIAESAIRNTMFLSVSYVLFHSGRGGIWASEVLAAIMVLSYLTYWLIYLAVFSFPALKFPRADTIRKVWRFSRPLVVSSTVDRLVSVDRVIIQYFFGAAQVGVYYSFLRMLQILPTYGRSLISVVFPALTSDRYDRKELFEGSEKFTVFIFMGIISMILPLSWAISNIFSRTLAENSSVFKVLAAWAFLMVASIPYTTFLMETEPGRRQMMYGSAIATVVNVILDLILIPIMGIIGAAYATLVSAALYNVIVRFEAGKEGIPPLTGSFLKAILAGAIVVSAAYFFGRVYYPVRIYAIVLFAALYLAMYVLVSVAINLVDLEDLRYLWRAASIPGIIDYIKEEIWGS